MNRLKLMKSISQIWDHLSYLGKYRVVEEGGKRKGRKGQGQGQGQGQAQDQNKVRTYSPIA